MGRWHAFAKGTALTAYFLAFGTSTLGMFISIRCGAAGFIGGLGGVVGSAYMWLQGMRADAYVSFVTVAALVAMFLMGSALPVRATPTLLLKSTVSIIGLCLLSAIIVVSVTPVGLSNCYP